MSARTKYADYTVRFGESSRLCQIEESLTGGFLRVTHTVNRIPSTREFLIWHRKDATPEERARTERGDFARRFRNTEMHPESPVVRLQINDRGTKRIAFQYMAGEHVDDPLIQLELEMMIDLTTGVSQ